MNTSTLERKYRYRLNNMPRPGEGRHQDSLGIANLGAMAGISPEQIHSDIRNAAGSVPLSESEIRKTVLKADAEHAARGSTYIPPPKPAPVVKDGKAALKRVIDKGIFSDDADLHDTSPVRLNGSNEDDRATILKVLFNPGDKIFIGDRLERGVIDKNIRTRDAWIDHFQKGSTAGPFIIINPLSGQSGLTKAGRFPSVAMRAFQFFVIALWSSITWGPRGSNPFLVCLPAPGGGIN